MAKTDEELQQAILNGDMASIESFIDQFEDEDDDDSGDGEDDVSALSGDDDNEDGSNDGAEDGKEAADDIANKDANTEQAPSADQLAATEADGVKPKLLSKDGKHEIPYEVLETTRKRTVELQEQLAEERRLREEAQTKLDKNTRQAELLSKQLQEAGIDPSQLPEDMQLTPELLAAISNDYGDLGKAVAYLASKQNAINTPAKEKPASEPEAKQLNQEFKAYYDSNPKLQEIMDKEGSDEFDTLDHFFNKIKVSPDFKDKPLSAQLDEAMARTMRVFGTDTTTATETDKAATADAESKAKLIAEEKLNAVRAAATPASPSEVGIAETSKPKAIDRARAANGQDLLNIMAELSPSELEALFDEMD